MRPLFQRFPNLHQHLAENGFAQLPTPVEQYDFDGQSVWVKRDDLSHSAYGGNKVRKLELILPEVQRLGAERVVTFGATGTHHGLATAVFCKQQGLGCDLLLFDQPVTALVQENIQLLAAQGTTLHHCGSLANTLRRFYLHPGRLSKRNYFLFAGGSNVLGVLAFINAALELKQQVDRGECAAPASIYCPASSNATLAGLTMGMALAGLDCQVIGVRVAPAKVGPFDSCTPKAVRSLMQKTVKWLQQKEIEWPVAVPSPTIVDDWYGAGYGHPTEAAAQAATLFENTVGVPLDPTYTAKCFAAVRAAKQSGPILYWHTLNSMPLAPLMDGLEQTSIPPSLRRLLSLPVLTP